MTTCWLLFNPSKSCFSFQVSRNTEKMALPAPAQWSVCRKFVPVGVGHLDGRNCFNNAYNMYVANSGHTSMKDKCQLLLSAARLYCPAPKPGLRVAFLQCCVWLYVIFYTVSCFCIPMQERTVSGGTHACRTGQRPGDERPPV